MWNAKRKKKQNKTKNYGYGQKAGTRGQIKNCPWPFQNHH